MWEDVTQSIQRLAEQAGPAVVGIGRGWGRGSGVVVAPGQVLTNAHNLRGPEVTITSAGGGSIRGAAAGVDADGDLAVVAVETAAQPLPWGESVPELGAPVFAVTNPGGRGLRVTVGTVSAVQQSFRGPRGRRIRGSIEHTAPLPRGSSGSALVDPDGRLVGISTHRLGEGFYLALPADAALRRRVEALGRGESPTRPRLGVGLAPAGASHRLRAAVGLPERSGVLVRVVEEGSPAERAGVRQGDLLVRAGTTDLAEPDDLYDALEAYQPPEPLELHVVRGVEEITLSVAL